MSNAAPPNDALTVRRARNGEASPQQTVQVWLIIGANGKFTLFLLNLTDTQTVVTVMHILQKKYKACKPKFLWYPTRVQIEEAEISPLCIGDLEAQDYPRPVLIQSTTPRPDLSEAFYDPKLVRGRRFLCLNAQFNITARVGQDAGSFRAILIKTKVSRWVVVSVLALVVLFTVGTGFLVGLRAGSVVLGLRTCGVVVGALAFIQTFCFEMKLLD